jgi:hypothetical protein
MSFETSKKIRIENYIIDKLSGSLSNLAVNVITETVKNWRFYFDENDKEVMRDKTKNFIKDMLENAGK